MAQTETNTCESVWPSWVYDASEDTESDLVIVTGGLGSGKTHGTAILAYDHICANPESRFFWAVAPTHRKVEDVLIPALQDALDLHFGLAVNVHYKITKGNTGWKLVFTAFKAPQIHFHSGDRPQLMVGTTICGYWITEPGIQKRLVFEKCQDRMRCGKARRLRGFIEGTPEGLNWYHELSQNETYKRVNEYTTRSTEIINRKPFTKTRLQLYTTDNSWIDTDSYVSRLMATYAGDEQRLASYLRGEFTEFGGGNAYSFVPSRDIVLDVETSPQLPIAMCWDFNHHPLAWTALQHQAHETKHRRLKRWVVLQESTGENTHLQTSCAEFIARFDPDIYYNTPIDIYGDNSGWASSHKMKGSDYEQIAKLLRPYYKKVTIRASKSNIGIRTSVNTVNRALMYEMLVVAAWCRNTINSFQRTAFKEGTFNFVKQAGEMITHWSDSIRPMIQQNMGDYDFTDIGTRKKTYGKNV